MTYNRKKVIDFCRKSIFPCVDIRQDMDVIETIKTVITWRRNAIKSGLICGTEEMTATVDNGFLFILSHPVGRIASKMPTTNFDEMSYHVEGMILARTEE